jgi:hypothetical protein
MDRMKQLLYAVFMIGGIAFAVSAMAQGVDVHVGVGIPLAPGQAGTSPGQVFNSARIANPNTAVPPGQLHTTGGPPPGQTFTNFGRSKK